MGFAKTMVLSVGGTKRASSDSSKTMVVSVAGRNANFKNDEEYVVSGKMLAERNAFSF